MDSERCEIYISAGSENKRDWKSCYLKRPRNITLIKVFKNLQLTLSKLLGSSIAAIAALIGFSTESSAQTIRINAGIDDSGYTNYIEAFEYDYVSEKPSFPGGESKLMEFINSNRVYPAEAYEKGIQGRVTCWFIVNADGSISNVNLLRSVNALLNEEAIRIFSLMPSWIPGRIDGIPVPVRVVRSVRFKK